MAKKNSSKTATEKAIQSSEPRVMSFKGWQGVNFVDAPLTWNPLESGQNKFRETDLPTNYLMVQNNLITTDTLGLETRPDSIIIGKVFERTMGNYYVFTGVATVYKRWIFAVMTYRFIGVNQGQYIVYKEVNSDPDNWENWSRIDIRIGETDYLPDIEINEINVFEGNLVATARYNNEGVLLLAKVDVSEDESTLTVTGKNWYGTTDLNNWIVDTPKIDNPSTNIHLNLNAHGMRFEDTEPTDPAIAEEVPVRISIKYCYTNRLGSTLTSSNANTIWVEKSPALWSSISYLEINPDIGEGSYGASFECHSVSGIDFYAREQENLDWVFIGHINVTPEQVLNGDWSYTWYGNMTDITQWLTSQLMIPTDNTSHGPDATYFSSHDSRMYFWGMPSKPYRLWIGGNPGSEFSVARGLGGAWVDIEPGSGYDIKGTAKWKTTSGANIITIMCGNRNTTKIKRFNLVETNLTLTNEVAYKSYMYEEVSNVVGCNSRWGYGVFSDGLYSLNRYGLMLTTMAMEYNAQMKNQKVSDTIDPIFTERLGKRLRDGRMVCINDIIYIAFSEDVDEEQPDEPIGLDNVILCYDMNLKAWYTWTHDQTLVEGSSDPDKVLHILPIDSDEFIEGLGVITEDEIRLYPTTGVQDTTAPQFQVLLETGELAPRQPKQAFWYLQQLEFRFDYFIGPEETEDFTRQDPRWPTILVEGVDYYGRQFKITKKLNIKSRGHHGLSGEQRDYVEWIRVDKIVESFRIRIKGRARFRLTHINAKLYQQADNIGTPYGFDAHDTYYNRKGEDHEIHHYIDDYNNLRRAVIS